MESSEIQSKMFDFLRFPLIVGVVFIHNYENGGGYEQTLFSGVIGRLAVPLFFLMSGYLFYYNTTFSKEVYIRKLKSRCRTLLVPYLFWIGLFIILHILLSNFPLTSSLSNESITMSPLECFVGSYEGSARIAYPLVYSFWFLRDLMVLVIFTPVIYWLLKQASVFVVLFVGICWFVGLNIPYLCAYGFYNESWFFFILGAYLSINNTLIVDLIAYVGRYIYALYAIVATVDTFTKDFDYNLYVHHAGILLGIICCFKFAASIVSKTDMRATPFLAKASFFVYVTHIPWILGPISAVLGVVISVDWFSGSALQYFLEVILTVLVALMLYYILDKMLPRLTAVVTGGR